MSTHVLFITENKTEVIYPKDKLCITKTTTHQYKVFEVGFENDGWIISNEVYDRLKIILYTMPPKN